MEFYFEVDDAKSFERVSEGEVAGKNGVTLADCEGVQDCQILDDGVTPVPSFSAEGQAALGLMLECQMITSKLSMEPRQTGGGCRWLSSQQSRNVTLTLIFSILSFNTFIIIIFFFCYSLVRYIFFQWRKRTGHFLALGTTYHTQTERLISAVRSPLVLASRTNGCENSIKSSLLPLDSHI